MSSKKRSKNHLTTLMKYVVLLCIFAILGSTAACSLPFKIVPNTQEEGPPPEEHWEEGQPPPEEHMPGEEPPPEPPPGEEPPPPGHEMNDEEAIKQALLAKLGLNEATMAFTVGRMDENFAEGGVNEVNAEMGGGMWFAAKDHGQWVIYHHGQDYPPCNIVDAYNVPPDWVQYCWDETSGTAMER